YHDGLNATVKGVVKVTGPPPAVTIGASLPIIVFGQQVSLSGVVSSGKTNEKVTIYQQPYPQTSFADLTTVLTTTNVAWNVVLRLRLPKGKSRIRVAMSINQAGAGYLDGYSGTITVRRR